MICVYSPDCTDFSTNGNGVLSPLTAQVTETLNGEYELQLTHPIDEAGKWQRLVEGCVLRAPVPASMTPRVEMISQAASAGRMIYKITTQSSNLRLRSGSLINPPVFPLADYPQDSSRQYPSELLSLESH